MWSSKGLNLNIHVGLNIKKIEQKLTCTLDKPTNLMQNISAGIVGDDVEIPTITLSVEEFAAKHEKSSPAPLSSQSNDKPSIKREKEGYDDDSGYTEAEKQR